MVTIQTSTGATTLPPGVTITSRTNRLLSALLDGLLAIVTLGIGWFIWSLFTYRNGQTPGKRLMGIRVISLNDGKALGFWMMLLREWVLKEVIGSITFGIAYVWILFDSKNQALYDKLINTVVVDDAGGMTLPEQTQTRQTTF